MHFPSLIRIRDILLSLPTDSSLPPLASFNRVGGSLVKASMTPVTAIGVAAFAAVYKDIKQPPDSLARATIYFQILTFGISCVLGLYVLFMSKNNLTNWQYKLHVVLVSFGGVCLMGNSVLLLALVNKVYAWLAFFLVAVPFVIGMLAFAGCQINGTNHLPRDQPFEAAIKTICDVACLIIGVALPMQVAVVFEYYNNHSLHVNQLPSAEISVTFLASVLGVISISITAMPLELLPFPVRSKLLFGIKFLTYPMLFLTATSAMILGRKFWGWLVLLKALTPPAVLVVIVAFPYRAVLKKLLTGVRVDPNPNTINEDLENPKQVDPDPNDDRVDPEIPAMLTNGINACIILLSTVYALYSTGGENINADAYLRAGVLVVEVIIASFLSCIALF